MEAKDVKNLMEAYASLYTESNGEEFETWVNTLVEEGYDLSEYTWDDMYEIYLNEAKKSDSPRQTFLPKSRERDIGRHDDWKDKPSEKWGERPEAGKKLKRRAQAVVGTQKRQDKEVGIREGTDLFDYILEHLVAEGYADTNENALVIMANMSEEWRDDILTEKLAKGTKGVSFATGRHAGRWDQAMTEKNPATGRQRKSSPELKAIGAHSRAQSAQWKAEKSGDTEAAARHKKRRETIAHVVYNKTNRIIDRADNH